MDRFAATEDRMTSDIKIDVYFATALALAIGILGLWPHFRFIAEVEEFRYLHYAYDEDTYILGWLNGALRSTRFLSGAALSTVNLVTAGSLNATMILSDFLFPAIATLAAYFAACQIAVSKPVRSLAAITLVFAGDLFSLGSQAIWASSTFNRFSHIIGMLGPNLVPPYETSFFSIYRTPEPQVSLTLMFIVLGLMAKLAKGEQSARTLGLSVATISLLPLGYTFVTFPVILIVVGALFVYSAHRMKAPSITILIGICGSVALYTLCSHWQPDNSQSTAVVAEALSYHSRLPIITPAVLASAVLGVTFAVWLVAARCWTPVALLALGCLITPFVLSNQQILTNTMISARDWERNASYQIIWFGAALAIAVIHSSKNWHTPTVSLVAPTSLLLLILFVAARGQNLTYKMWLPHNEASIAMTRALNALDQKEVIASEITLENASLAPLLQLRFGAKLDIPLSFYRAGIDLIPNMEAKAIAALPSPLEPAAFANWDHNGIDPNDAEKLVKTEIQQKAGSYISYLFSFRDSWYPASDNRAVRPTELLRSIGPLIDRYRIYLCRNRDTKPHLLVSTKSNPKNTRYTDVLLSSAKADNSSASVFRQEPSYLACNTT